MCFNNKIIFIGVPAHTISYQTIENFAEVNNVPCFLEKIPELYTNDRSHLERKSVVRYSEWLESVLEDVFLNLK